MADKELELLAHAFLGHFRKHHAGVGHSKAEVAVLDTIARKWNAVAMEELAIQFQQVLQIKPTLAIFEVLLGAILLHGTWRRSREVCPGC